MISKLGSVTYETPPITAPGQLVMFFEFPSILPSASACVCVCVCLCVCVCVCVCVCRICVCCVHAREHTPTPTPTQAPFSLFSRGSVVVYSQSFNRSIVDRHRRALQGSLCMS
jgi:hypothetical protein